MLVCMYMYVDFKITSFKSFTKLMYKLLLMEPLHRRELNYCSKKWFKLHASAEISIH